jgi:hypothetical protein
MIIHSIPPRKKKRKSISRDNPAPEQQLPEESSEKEQKTIEHQTIVNEQEQDQAVNQSDRLLEGGKEGFMD